LRQRMDPSIRYANRAAAMQITQRARPVFSAQPTQAQEEAAAKRAEGEAAVEEVVTPTKSKGIFGIGPLYTAPTASNPVIGQKQHQVGAAAIGLWSKGILLVGGLLNYRIGVVGDPMRPRAQSIAVQPAMYIQIGQGFYLRSVPIRAAHANSSFR